MIHACLKNSLGLLFAAGLALTPLAAWSKDTGLIFVGNEKTNNIIVIDPKTYQVVKDIRVARRPRDMHFNSDHTKLYVACGDDDVIDIIDVAKLEVVGKLKSGASPETFAMDEKRHRIYVSDEEGSALSIIDMDQNITVFEVPTGAEPEGVMVSEDGKTVYVTSEVGDIVHRVDADRGYVTDDVVVGTRPRRFAATPDGRELWVSCELSGEVYIIDRDKFTVSGRIEFLPPGMRKSDVTPVGLTMTKDGKTAYVTLGHSAHVAVVDVLTRKIEAYVLVGKRSWGITLSKDESKLYVANGFGDDITVIDAKTRKAIISIPVGRIPWGWSSMSKDRSDPLDFGGPVPLIARSGPSRGVRSIRALTGSIGLAALQMSAYVQMLWGERRGHGTFGAVQRLPKELSHAATTLSF
jgi:PQQ-dependent catabolism-associated beta-propeller protein